MMVVVGCRACARISRRQERYILFLFISFPFFCCISYEETGVSYEETMVISEIIGVFSEIIGVFSERIGDFFMRKIA